MINDKVQQIGMKNIHFMNCYGIDEESHYTTAKDIAIILAEIINKIDNKIIRNSDLIVDKDIEKNQALYIISKKYLKSICLEAKIKSKNLLF